MVLAALINATAAPAISWGIRRILLNLLSAAPGLFTNCGSVVYACAG